MSVYRTAVITFVRRASVFAAYVYAAVAATAAAAAVVVAATAAAGDSEMRFRIASKVTTLTLSTCKTP